MRSAARRFRYGRGATTARDQAGEVSPCSSPLARFGKWGGVGVRKQRKAAARFVAARADKRRRVSVKKVLVQAWCSHGYPGETPLKPLKCASMRNLLENRLDEVLPVPQKRDRSRKLRTEEHRVEWCNSSQMQFTLAEVTAAMALSILQIQAELVGEVLWCAAILLEFRSQLLH